MQVKKQQLELDIEKQTGPKQEKEYVKAVYCHPAYLSDSGTKVLHHTNGLNLYLVSSPGNC